MSLCGSGRVVGSMTLPSLNPTRKPGDAASGQFPAGLRVLVVDDDPTCLKILERMLRTCLYEVTKCDRAEHALNELRRNKNGFDVVLSDVHMPDMDGFKLLEHIGLEMDLPVIMMSADDSKNVVMKGVTHGACDYLIKPVRIEALKNIWQHVVRKKKNEWKDNIEQSGSLEEGDRAPKQEDAEYSSPANEGSWKSSNRKGDDDEGEDKEDSSGLKKPRVVWSVELHQQFVGAVNQLGIDKAVPKKILELMNVPGLTRENVASHLQKYRLYLRRLSGVSHQGGLNSAFMGPQDPSFGTMPALGGFDLQTLAATGQLPGQTLAGYQPGLVRSAVKPGISMPFLDQRNLFSFESPKLRFGEGQHQQQQLSNTNKQMNLLHGIPTTMELKQLPSFHQPTQGIQSSSLLMPMVQPQTRPGQLMNESIGGQISQIQSPIMGQTILSGGGVLPRTGVPDNSQAMMSYGSVSQASSVVDFSVNRAQDMTCNSFPLGSTLAITTSKGLIKEEVNSNGKRPRLMGPNYDMFSELPQRKSQDWQGSSLGYGVPQHTSSIGNSTVVSPSILVNQGFSSGQKAGQNLNSIGANSPMFSTDIEVMQQGISTQSSNNALIDNVSLRVKTENDQDMSSGNHLYSYQYAQDDLMSAILKQPESLGSVEGEFDFDGYTIDNILV